MHEVNGYKILIDGLAVIQVANIKHAVQSEEGIAEADLRPGLVEHAWHIKLE